jgi:hypothetical protein
LLPIAGALAAGATIAFFLDPRSGKRRRALMRDQLVHATHRVRDLITKREHRLMWRGAGIVAATKSRLRGRIVDDDILVERVRSSLGRVCSHPHCIEVHVREKGSIELLGYVLTNEHQRILRAIAHVPGVHRIQDLLADRTRDEDVLAWHSVSPASAIKQVHVPS